MRAILRPLLVLHSDAVFREQVRRAGGKRFEFRQVTDWEDLRARTSMAPPAALILVDPYVDGGGQLAAPLRSLLLEFPSATIVAALDLRPERYRDLRTLGAWGVAEVIALGEEDTGDSIAR